MRGIVAILLAACLTPVVAVAQEWKGYSYADPGFAIQFPSPPAVAQSTFTTSAGVSLPMTRYTAEQNHNVYSLDVVDFSTTTADAMATIAETEKSFGASGKVTVA